jgi:hypothetical protein
MEGLSFLVVGFALGERGLGLFPADVLANLRVVLLLGLAWIGLVFGLQIDLGIIRQLKPWHRRVGLVVPLLSGGLLLAGGLLLRLPLPLALGLAAVGTVSSPSTMEGLARGRAPADRSALRLLKLVMAFSGLPAVAVLAVATALWSPVSALVGGPVAAWQVLFVVLGVGVLMGYALLVLVRGVRDPLHLLTLLTGMMAAVAGACAVLGVSALPAAACVGAVVMNRCVFPHRMLKVAHSLEMPMLIALLVVVGASWTAGTFSWPTFALMALIRPLASMLAGAVLSASAARQGVTLSVPWLGCGLLAQGELAMGLLVALVGTLGGVDGVLEAVVAAMVLNHAVGQVWTRRALFRAPAGGAG